MQHHGLRVLHAAGLQRSAMRSSQSLRYLECNNFNNGCLVVFKRVRSREHLIVHEYEICIDVGACVVSTNFSRHNLTAYEVAV
jgi:hypothetical protein